MSLLLLFIIYIAFIGLGIPDSLFGAAWPAIYTEFGLPVGTASYITLIISGGTVISCLFATRLIQRFGTAKITAFSTLLTALALLGFSFSNHIAWFFLFALPLGLGAGAIDSALNNYVALHYKAAHMNFLHCFYGIGVSLSPYLMSLALSAEANWRKGYRIVFWFQIGISFITILSLPIWKKVSSSTFDQEETSRTVSIFSLWKQAKIRMACLIFIGSCAIEYTCGIWGSTFLVNTKEVTMDMAAKIITFYYIGIALGRFLSGLLSNKLTSWQIITIGQGVTFFAILLLIFPFPSQISGIGLFMIGLGNSPIFPNILHLTPQNFGRGFSQSAIGIQMAASYTSIMLAPAFFGAIAQKITIALYPYYLLVMFCIMIGGTFLLKTKLKRENSKMGG